MTEADKRYYEKHKDKIKERNHQRYLKNKDKFKAYNDQHNKQYYHTKKGLLTNIYWMQIQKYKEKGYERHQVFYTKDEFINRWINDPVFIKLYNQWVEGDFFRWLSPSIDRIDVLKGYSFDNTQCVTWLENRLKAIDDCKILRLLKGEK